MLAINGEWIAHACDASVRPWAVSGHRLYPACLGLSTCRQTLVAAAVVSPIQPGSACPAVVAAMPTSRHDPAAARVVSPIPPACAYPVVVVPPMPTGRLDPDPAPRVTPIQPACVCHAAEPQSPLLLSEREASIRSGGRNPFSDRHCAPVHTRQWRRFAVSSHAIIELCLSQDCSHGRW
jgi:hypothetical protein